MDPYIRDCNSDNLGDDGIPQIWNRVRVFKSLYFHNSFNLMIEEDIHSLFEIWIQNKNKKQ